MKVIFVGMHNKPNTMPLCSSTKSGKLIDRIINQVFHRGDGGIDGTWQKTNLFDDEKLPRTDEEKATLALDWLDRVNLQKDDVIVLLGQMVHEWFPSIPTQKIIKIAHPASKRSHFEMNEYVYKTAQQIREMVNNKRPSVTPLA